MNRSSSPHFVVLNIQSKHIAYSWDFNYANAQSHYNIGPKLTTFTTVHTHRLTCQLMQQCNSTVHSTLILALKFSYPLSCLLLDGPVS